jgi:hypothetical protein
VKKTVIAIALSMCAVPSFAQQKPVPVLMHAWEDLDTCSLGEVKVATAVRTGPSVSHHKIETLKRGTRVWLFDERPGWIGVVYGLKQLECSPIKKDKPYDGPGKSGWVPEKHVRGLAG